MRDSGPGTSCWARSPVLRLASLGQRATKSSRPSTCSALLEPAKPLHAGVRVSGLMTTGKGTSSGGGGSSGAGSRRWARGTGSSRRAARASNRPLSTSCSMRSGSASISRRPPASRSRWREASSSVASVCGKRTGGRGWERASSSSARTSSCWRSHWSIHGNEARTWREKRAESSAKPKKALWMPAIPSARTMSTSPITRARAAVLGRRHQAPAPRRSSERASHT